jgi:hypothetical protein
MTASRHPKLTKRTITMLADDADLRWICGVVDSGFHNGAGCHPGEDHHDESWRCGWYWRATVPALRGQVKER